MADKERWVYKDGKLTTKITVRDKSDGSKEIITQKANTDILGGRRATKIISTTRIPKP
jgi:hypothetical protein